MRVMMVQIRRVALILAFAMLSVGVAQAQASGAKSPEALGMALVNAYRSGDAETIVALHYFVPAAGAAIAEQQIPIRTEWRRLMRRYKLSGYRVTDLSAEERQRFNVAAQLSLAPIKKLIINLVAGNGAEQLSANRYIGSVSGDYFFVTSSGR